MAEVKISALGSAVSLTGSEAVPVVQTGVTRKTTTQEIAALLQPAINVVSAALVTEQNARNVDVTRLSDAISGIIADGDGAISVNSDKLSAASATANLHINAVSLNLDTEILDRKSMICVVSAKNSAGTSVHGFQSIVNALSDRISGVVAGAVSVTSAEVSLLQNTSVRNSAGTSVKGRQSVFNALSGRISDVEAHASAASDAATSANVHANAASAAATSVLCILQNASIKSGANSVRGIQSVLNQISTHLQALSAGGIAVSVTSNKLSIAIGVSVKSNATSVKGLQSVVNNLSTRIANVVAGTFSVTSTKVSLVSAQAASAISVMNVILGQAINDRVSADGVLSFRNTVVADALSAETARALSAEKAFSDVLSAAAINTASVLAGISTNMVSDAARLSVLICAHNSLVDRVSALSAVGGPVSVNSNEFSQRISLAVSALNKASVRNTAAVSVQGHQSVLNALSAKIGAGGGSGSVTSARVNGISAGVSSLQGAVAVNSAAYISLLFKHSALSNVVSDIISIRQIMSDRICLVSVHADVASLAATSADGHANTVSVNLTSVDNRATSIELRLSTLSAAFSQLQSVVSNALSAGDVTSSKIANLSNRVSVLSQAHSVLSAGIGIPQLRVLTTTATISASGLTKISGLSLDLVCAKAYQIHAVLHHSHSTQGTNGFGFGVSAPGATTATGVWRGYVSVVAPSGASAVQGFFNQAGFGSITYSATPTASATNYRTELDLDIAGATSGKLQLKARSSAATTGAIDVRAGSYIRSWRLN